jgi:hypothetical protein
MLSLRPFTRLSLMSLAVLPYLFMLNGCIVHDRTVVHEPTEGYYDREHHRWYHEHVWVECDARDRHCPPA